MPTPDPSLLLTGRENAWQGSQDSTGRNDSITYKVPWQESEAFYEAVVGTPQTIDLGNGNTITRSIPLQHPWSPRLYANRLSYRGADGINKPADAVYKWIIVTVGFAVPGFSMGGSGEGGGSNDGGNGADPPFCRTSSKASTRTVTDTSRQYSYTDDNGNKIQVPHGVGIQMGGNVYTLELFAIEDLEAWQALVAPMNGKVNSQPFKIGAFVRQPGTVLFEGYGYDQVQNLSGSIQWTGSVVLNCSALPWNSTIVAGKRRVLSPLPYPDSADFNSLYL